MFAGSTQIDFITFHLEMHDQNATLRPAAIAICKSRIVVSVYRLFLLASTNAVGSR
jgi:hypothetical protein